MGMVWTLKLFKQKSFDSSTGYGPSRYQYPPRSPLDSLDKQIQNVLEGAHSALLALGWGGYFLFVWRVQTDVEERRKNPKTPNPALGTQSQQIPTQERKLGKGEKEAGAEERKKERVGPITVKYQRCIKRQKWAIRSTHWTTVLP